MTAPKPYTVTLAVDAQNTLGEGCLWDEQAGALYWADIEGRFIQRWRPGGRVEKWELPERVGSFSLRRGGGLVVALASGFAFVTLDPLTIERIAAPEAHLPGNRFNDGRTDAQGRFWAGTMDLRKKAPSGSLYRLDPDRSWRRMQEGICIPNSTAWSPDARVMYFADSIARTIWAYDFDEASGSIRNRRVFATTEAPIGPDGSTVDAHGFLWNAQWGASRVRCYSHDGLVRMDVPLPVSQPTCCCFGGPDLRTLYVTSAREDLSPAQLAREPHAGGVFAVEFDTSLDIRGRVENRFAG